MDESTIHMERFHDGQWQELPTIQLMESDGFLHFIAQTPGFSIFSIVGDEVRETVNQETSVSNTPDEEIQDEVEAVEIRTKRQ
ncbi:PGF-pre-PGF domain-containing protein [Methanococcoides methylutens]|uniref:PGF-pre-PGF domain-containing protein n=1 Tax=Methanococcoides methylutens TaxID=2226 RepID=UPI0040445796